MPRLRVPIRTIADVAMREPAGRMYLAELRHLQAILPIEIFLTTGSFSVELHNTEQASIAFPNGAVEEHVALWTQRIARGEHFPPETV